MLLAKIDAHHGEAATFDYRGLVWTLVSLWALAAIVFVLLAVASYAPGHLGFGEYLRQINDSLPGDPRLWVGIAS